MIRTSENMFVLEVKRKANSKIFHNALSVCYTGFAIEGVHFNREPGHATCCSKDIALHGHACRLRKTSCHLQGDKLKSETVSKSRQFILLILDNVTKTAAGKLHLLQCI